MGDLWGVLFLLFMEGQVTDIIEMEGLAEWVVLSFLVMAVVAMAIVPPHVRPSLAVDPDEVGEHEVGPPSTELGESCSCSSSSSPSAVVAVAMVFMVTVVLSDGNARLLLLLANKSETCSELHRGSNACKSFPCFTTASILQATEQYL